MATTTATLSISSNILGNPTAISKTMTMSKSANPSVGLDETTGLRTKKFTSTTDAVIAEADELTSSGGTEAHKLYVRNASTSKVNFFYIAYNASAAGATTTETIGKLYGGDWMLIPYDGNVNINAASSSETDTQYLEYMVFADGVVTAAG